MGKCITWSWKEFNQIYTLLGVHFTENNGRGYGESFFEDKMQSVIEELEAKGLLTASEGAKLVFFPGEKYPPLMIIKDGATLYSTRDLATDKFRLQHYGKDIVVVNEVGVEQTLYFRQLFETEQLLGWFAPGQRVHIRHGLYRFKDEKMSTRMGNTIWLEDVINFAIDKARHIGIPKDMQKPWTFDKTGKPIGVAGGLYGKSNKTSSIVGIGALKWNDLKRSSEQDIVFDWDDILNMQGNSGPYMQYTFVRTQSVLLKTDISELRTKNLKEGLTIKIEERELIRLLGQFTEIVEESAVRFAPNILCTYLFNLAQAFNLFYQKYPILKAEENTREFRLLITQATGEVIKKGLYLLGIQAPDRM